MEINYEMLVAMLQQELACVQEDLETTMADLEKEETIQEKLEREVGKLSFDNNMLLVNRIALELQLEDLNTDFFNLGDMLMLAIGGKQPEQKPASEVTVSDEFLKEQYQERIEYLEELIFDFGDEIQECRRALGKHEKIEKLIISRGAEDISDLRKDKEDTEADWAKEASEWRLIDKLHLNELVDHRRTIRELKDEIEMKTRVNQEAVYADKKCKFDLEQKIAALEEENKKLKFKVLNVEGSSSMLPEEVVKKAKEALEDIVDELEESNLFEAEEKILKENKYRIKKNGNGVAGVKRGCIKIECYKQSENSEPQYVVGEFRTRDVYKAMEESASSSYVKEA